MILSVSLMPLLGLPVRAATGSAGEIDLGEFAASTEGGQFVEVNLKQHLISMVARLAERDEPEIARLLKGLESVRVNVIGLGADNRAEVTQRIQGLRTQLAERGWERVVTAQEKDQDVGVYLKTRGDEAVEGLVVTVIEGDREAVIVNIVGDIRPEQLVVIGERFNVEPLKKLGPRADKS